MRVDENEPGHGQQACVWKGQVGPRGKGHGGPITNVASQNKKSRVKIFFLSNNFYSEFKSQFAIQRTTILDTR
jgi:hypothetical protein